MQYQASSLPQSHSELTDHPNVSCRIRSITPAMSSCTPWLQYANLVPSNSDVLCHVFKLTLYALGVADVEKIHVKHDLSYLALVLLSLDTPFSLRQTPSGHGFPPQYVFSSQCLPSSYPRPKLSIRFEFAICLSKCFETTKRVPAKVRNPMPQTSPLSLKKDIRSWKTRS